MPDEQDGNMTEQQEEALSNWIDENKKRISNAFLSAAMRIDGISEMLTDQDAGNTDYVRQKVSGIITSTNAVFKELLTEEVVNEFSEVGDELREGLKHNVPRVVDAHMSQYQDVLVQHILNSRRSPTTA